MGALEAGFIVVAVWLALLLLDALSHRQSLTANPPPRPDWVRKQLETKPVTGGLAVGLMALFFLPLLVPGVLLLALAEGGVGRALGVGLVAWAVGQFAIGVWRGRPARNKRYQARLLAHSEAFWSRPDAEEWAARLRGRSPLTRGR